MGKFLTAALAGASLAAIAAPASADLIVVGGSQDNSYQAAFWTADINFLLPAGFSNAVLNISAFYADDRGVAQLNGSDILSVGIYGPGTGNFRYTPGGPNDPHVFGPNGPQNVNITSGFVTGLNTIHIIVNDTWNGIYGDIGGAGPTSYTFEGTVTYDVSPVPEAATWAMMIAGFAAVGSTMRRRAQRIAFA